VHVVLKKCENCKFNHLFIQIFFSFALQTFFALCSMNKLFEKTKISDSTEVFSFSIEKLWKMVFENV